MDQLIRDIFDKQQTNRWRVARTPAEVRIQKLRALKKAIKSRQRELQQAIYSDFRKSTAEVDMTELHPTLSEITHTIKHLKHWMRPKKVRTPLVLWGTRSEIRYEPKGIVLILSPWNYPFNLLVSPLIGAIAAGNCVVCKPSQKVPHTSRFIKNLVASVFDESEVAVCEGDHGVADALLQLPFDHVFFTGSPGVGKKVMAAAAQHLASVTLELGGKSPVVIDASADMDKTCQKVMWGKFINAGQTCVAPDYVLVHESRQAEFVKKSIEIIQRRFGKTEDDRMQSEDFCRLVSSSHLSRLESLLNDSVRAGAKIEIGGKFDPETNYLSPTLLSNVTLSHPIMKEEIFGPILPVISFSMLDEAIDVIQKGQKPLALYVFGQDPDQVQRVLSHTTTGGSCVNHTILHVANPNLPFGGVGHSGMGSYHGHFGFRTFSHERAVLKQGRWLDTIRFFYPPYTDGVKRRIETVMRWLS